MTTILLDHSETHTTPRKVIQNNLFFWVVRRGFWTPGTGFRTPKSVDLGFRTQDSGHRSGIPDSGFRTRKQDSGFLERDFYLRILVP